MKEILTPESASLVMQLANQVRDAAIFQGTTVAPFGVQSITLDLTTARLQTQPYKIGFPFKSVYVSSATDTTVSVNLVPNTQDSYQSSVPFGLNDSWTVDQPVSNAFLFWSAQSGKSITIHFFVDSEFRSGKQISVTGGGVTLVDGSSHTQTRVDLTAATATLVLSSDSTRKNATIQNNTGSDVWFGGSSVSNTGANLGYKVAAGGDFIYKNTGALYAYSVAGGTGDNGLLTFVEV